MFDTNTEDTTMPSTESTPFEGTEPFAEEARPSIELPETTKTKESKYTTKTMSVASSHGYPWIDNKGELKFGIAAVLDDAAEAEDMFAEKSDPQMVLIDSETRKTITIELDFDKANLSKKFKEITDESFTTLTNLRRQVTLLKAYKNIIPQVKKFNQIDFETKAQKDTLIAVVKKAEGQSKTILKNMSMGQAGSLGEMLTKYAFKKHLLVSGDAGNGKTYQIDKFVKENKLPMVQYIGHQGTESIDLIGHLIKLPDGTFGWKDGALSKAFRMAQTQQVVLFVDEMLRIPSRELNLLVGSLTPNSQGELILRTDRPHGEPVDGIVSAEEIAVPQENLWVVASSNQGAGYQTARIDEALKDRFRLYYQEMSEGEVTEIMEEKLARHKTSTIFLKSLVSLIKKTEEIKGTGNIPRSFTIRHLAEAVDTADDAKDIKSRMFDLINNIIAIDASGRFNPEQKKIIHSLIKGTI